MVTLTVCQENLHHIRVDDLVLATIQKNLKGKQLSLFIPPI